MPQPKKTGRGHGKLTPEQWAEIGARYEAGESVNSLSVTFGVSRAAIQKKADKSNWKRDSEAAIQRRMEEKVAGVVTPDATKKELAIEAESDRRAAILRKHREEWLVVEDLEREALAQRGGKKNSKGVLMAPASFEPFKQMKIVAEALEIKQRGERKAWNIEDKPIKVEHSGEFGDSAKKPLDDEALKGKSLAELTTMFQEEIGAGRGTK